MVTFYRRLPRIDYLRPGSVVEALSHLSQQNGRSKVFAGGTDLLPKLKQRVIDPPAVVIDLKGIPDLDYIRWSPAQDLAIGSLTTLSSVVESQVVREKFPILCEAAGSIASPQVRNRGTLAGNICNAVPSADSAPALLALDAKLRCVSSGGERWVEAKDFFKGPTQTVLGPAELVTEILVPNPPADSRGCYVKLSPRRRMDLAVVGVGVSLSLKDGSFQDVRIALGAVAPTPIRAYEAEKILAGQKVKDELIAEAARVASTEARPIDDHRASAEYRKWMVEVLVKRVLNQAVGH